MHSASLIFATLLLATSVAGLRAQEDGGVSVGFDNNGRGQELLESIFIPYLPNAPFSLTLATEWSRPMGNGGSYTVVNSRPLKRDSVGRIYQERWLLSPKGSNRPPRMSWIQIADPVAHTIYQCDVPHKVCDLVGLSDRTDLRLKPELSRSAPLKEDKGTYTHEDLGPQFFVGLPVHGYRDTTVLNPGVLGNDRPMTTTRDFRFSPDLGFNLSSTLDTPQLGRQTFTVTEINTAEPDPHFFQPPDGYQVVDRRKPKDPVQ